MRHLLSKKPRLAQRLTPNLGRPDGALLTARPGIAKRADIAKLSMKALLACLDSSLRLLEDALQTSKHLHI